MLERRTESLAEIPQEKLSKEILNRQNIKVRKEIFDRQQWKFFHIENTFVDKKLIEKFNSTPNKELLLEIGLNFILQLENQLSFSEIKSINIQHISDFMYIYLYNLQEGNHSVLTLKYIKYQKQVFNQLLITHRWLENNPIVDLLIEFSKGLHRGYLKHYWLRWTRETLEYIQKFSYADRKESEKKLSKILSTIHSADDDQLEQINSEIKFSCVIREIPCFDFDEKLYKNNKSQ
ncbi:unnamed protein product, partial [Rotaria sp. Silwood2]